MNIQNYKQWYSMKKAMLKGLDCVLCGKPATELHHPQKFYGGRYEYLNAENQVPLCRNCHYSKIHIMSKGKESIWNINGKSTKVRVRKCMGGGFD